MDFVEACLAPAILFVEHKTYYDRLAEAILDSRSHRGVSLSTNKIHFG